VNIGQRIAASLCSMRHLWVRLLKPRLAEIGKEPLFIETVRRGGLLQGELRVQPEHFRRFGPSRIHLSRAA
jgi:hypothetical protein